MSASIDTIKTIHFYDRNSLNEIISSNRKFKVENPSILLLKKGAVCFKHNSLNIKIAAPALSIINSGSNYEFENLADDAALSVVSFGRFFIDMIPLNLDRYRLYTNLMAGLYYNLTPSQLQFDTLWQLVELLKNYSETIPPAGYFCNLQRHLCAATVYAVADIVLANENATDKPAGRKEEITIAFFRAVSQYFKQHRSIMHYAEKLQLTPQYLTIIVKEITGRTPHHFINDFLAMEAKSMLVSTESSIKEIALALEFSDQYNFSHFFLNKTGLSPTAYRDKYRY